MRYIKNTQQKNIIIRQLQNEGENGLLGIERFTKGGAVNEPCRTSVFTTVVNRSWPK